MRNRTQRYKRRTKANPINKKKRPGNIKEIAAELGMNPTEFIKFNKHKFSINPKFEHLLKKR